MEHLPTRSSRKAGMSAEAFQADCLARQRITVKPADGLQGLAMTQLRPVTRSRFVFDAVIESWWDQDRGIARASSGWLSVRSSLDSIVDSGGSVSVAVRDHVFVTPPAFNSG